MMQSAYIAFRTSKENRAALDAEAERRGYKDRTELLERLCAEHIPGFEYKVRPEGKPPKKRHEP